MDETTLKEKAKNVMNSSMIQCILIHSKSTYDIFDKFVFCPQGTFQSNSRPKDRKYFPYATFYSYLVSTGISQAVLSYSDDPTLAPLLSQKPILKVLEETTSANKAVIDPNVGATIPTIGFLTNQLFNLGFITSSMRKVIALNAPGFPLPSQVCYLSSSSPAFVLDPDHGSTFATFPENTSIVENATSMALDEMTKLIKTVRVSNEGAVERASAHNIQIDSEGASKATRLSRQVQSRSMLRPLNAGHAQTDAEKAKGGAVEGETIIPVRLVSREEVTRAKAVMEVMQGTGHFGQPLKRGIAGEMERQREKEEKKKREYKRIAKEEREKTAHDEATMRRGDREYEVLERGKLELRQIDPKKVDDDTPEILKTSTDKPRLLNPIRDSPTTATVQEQLKEEEKSEGQAKEDLEKKNEEWRAPIDKNVEDTDEIIEPPPIHAKGYSSLAQSATHPSQTQSPATKALPPELSVTPSPSNTSPFPSSLAPSGTITPNSEDGAPINAEPEGPFFLSASHSIAMQKANFYSFPNHTIPVTEGGTDCDVMVFEYIYQIGLIMVGRAHNIIEIYSSAQHYLQTLCVEDGEDWLWGQGKPKPEKKKRDLRPSRSEKAAPKKRRLLKGETTATAKSSLANSRAASPPPPKPDDTDSSDTETKMTRKETSSKTNEEQEEKQASHSADTGTITGITFLPAPPPPILRLPSANPDDTPKYCSLSSRDPVELNAIFPLYPNKVVPVSSEIHAIAASTTNGTINIWAILKIRPPSDFRTNTPTLMNQSRDDTVTTPDLFDYFFSNPLVIHLNPRVYAPAYPSIKHTTSHDPIVSCTFVDIGATVTMLSAIEKRKDESGFGVPLREQVFLDPDVFDSRMMSPTVSVAPSPQLTSRQSGGTRNFETSLTPYRKPRLVNPIDELAAFASAVLCEIENEKCANCDFFSNTPLFLPQAFSLESDESTQPPRMTTTAQTPQLPGKSSPQSSIRDRTRRGETAKSQFEVFEECLPYPGYMGVRYFPHNGIISSPLGPPLPKHRKRSSPLPIVISLLSNDTEQTVTTRSMKHYTNRPNSSLSTSRSSASLLTTRPSKADLHSMNDDESLFSSLPTLPVSLGGNGALVVVGYSGTVTIISLDTLQILCTYSAHDDGVTETTIVDNTCLLMGFEDGTIELWPILQPEFPSQQNPYCKPVEPPTDPLKRYLSHTLSITGLCIPWDRRSSFISCSLDSSIILWSLDSEDPLSVMDLIEPVISATFFTSSGQFKADEFLVLGFDSAVVRIPFPVEPEEWRLAQIAILEGHEPVKSTKAGRFGPVLKQERPQKVGKREALDAQEDLRVARKMERLQAGKASLNTEIMVHLAKLEQEEVNEQKAIDLRKRMGLDILDETAEDDPKKGKKKDGKGSTKKDGKSSISAQGHIANHLVNGTAMEKQRQIDYHLTSLFRPVPEKPIVISDWRSLVAARKRVLEKLKVEQEKKDNKGMTKEEVEREQNMGKLLFADAHKLKTENERKEYIKRLSEMAMIGDDREDDVAVPDFADNTKVTSEQMVLLGDLQVDETEPSEPVTLNKTSTVGMGLTQTVTEDGTELRTAGDDSIEPLPVISRMIKSQHDFNQEKRSDQHQIREKKGITKLFDEIGNNMPVPPDSSVLKAMSGQKDIVSGIRVLISTHQLRSDELVSNQPTLFSSNQTPIDLTPQLKVSEGITVHSSVKTTDGTVVVPVPTTRPPPSTLETIIVRAQEGRDKMNQQNLPAKEETETTQTLVVSDGAADRFIERLKEKETRAKSRAISLQSTQSLNPTPLASTPQLSTYNSTTTSISTMMDQTLTAEEIRQNMAEEEDKLRAQKAETLRKQKEAKARVLSDKLRIPAPSSSYHFDDRSLLVAMIESIHNSRTPSFDLFVKEHKPNQALVDAIIREMSGRPPSAESSHYSLRSVPSARISTPASRRRRKSQVDGSERPITPHSSKGPMSSPLHSTMTDATVFPEVPEETPKKKRKRLPYMFMVEKRLSNNEEFEDDGVRVVSELTQQIYPDEIENMKKEGKQVEVAKPHEKYDTDTTNWIHLPTELRAPHSRPGKKTLTKTQSLLAPVDEEGTAPEKTVSPTFLEQSQKGPQPSLKSDQHSLRSSAPSATSHRSKKLVPLALRDDAVVKIVGTKTESRSFVSELARQSTETVKDLTGQDPTAISEQTEQNKAKAMALRSSYHIGDRKGAGKRKQKEQTPKKDPKQDIALTGNKISTDEEVNNRTWTVPTEILNGLESSMKVESTPAQTPVIRSQRTLPKIAKPKAAIPAAKVFDMTSIPEYDKKETRLQRVYQARLQEIEEHARELQELAARREALRKKEEEEAESEWETEEESEDEYLKPRTVSFGDGSMARWGAGASSYPGHPFPTQTTDEPERPQNLIEWVKSPLKPREYQLPLQPTRTLTQEESLQLARLMINNERPSTSVVQQSLNDMNIEFETFTPSHQRRRSASRRRPRSSSAPHHSTVKAELLKQMSGEDSTFTNFPIYPIFSDDVLLWPRSYSPTRRSTDLVISPSQQSPSYPSSPNVHSGAFTSHTNTARHYVPPSRDSYVEDPGLPEHGPMYPPSQYLLQIIALLDDEKRQALLDDLPESYRALVKEYLEEYMKTHKKEIEKKRETQKIADEKKKKRLEERARLVTVLPFDGNNQHPNPFVTWQLLPFAQLTQLEPQEFAHAMRLIPRPIRQQIANRVQLPKEFSLSPIVQPFFERPTSAIGRIEDTTDDEQVQQLLWHERLQEIIKDRQRNYLKKGRREEIAKQEREKKQKRARAFENAGTIEKRLEEWITPSPSTTTLQEVAKKAKESPTSEPIEPKSMPIKNVQVDQFGLQTLQTDKTASQQEHKPELVVIKPKSVGTKYHLREDIRDILSGTASGKTSPRLSVGTQDQSGRTTTTDMESQDTVEDEEYSDYDEQSARRQTLGHYEKVSMRPKSKHSQKTESVRSENGSVASDRTDEHDSEEYQEEDEEDEEYAGDSQDEDNEDVKDAGIINPLTKKKKKGSKRPKFLLDFSLSKEYPDVVYHERRKPALAGEEQEVDPFQALRAEEEMDTERLLQLIADGVAPTDEENEEGKESVLPEFKIEEMSQDDQAVLDQFEKEMKLSTFHRKRSEAVGRNKGEESGFLGAFQTELEPLIEEDNEAADFDSATFFKIKKRKKRTSKSPSSPHADEEESESSLSERESSPPHPPFFRRSLSSVELWSPYRTLVDDGKEHPTQTSQTDSENNSAFSPSVSGTTTAQELTPTDTPQPSPPLSGRKAAGEGFRADTMKKIIGSLQKAPGGTILTSSAIDKILEPGNGDQYTFFPDRVRPASFTSNASRLKTLQTEAETAVEFYQSLERLRSHPRREGIGGTGSFNQFVDNVAENTSSEQTRTMSRIRQAELAVQEGIVLPLEQKTNNFTQEDGSFLNQLRNDPSVPKVERFFGNNQIALFQNKNALSRIFLYNLSSFPGTVDDDTLFGTEAPNAVRLADKTSKLNVLAKSSSKMLSRKATSSSVRSEPTSPKKAGNQQSMSNLLTMEIPEDIFEEQSPKEAGTPTQEPKKELTAKEQAIERMDQMLLDNMNTNAHRQTTATVRRRNSLTGQPIQVVDGQEQIIVEEGLGNLQVPVWSITLAPTSVASSLSQQYPQKDERKEETEEETRMGKIAEQMKNLGRADRRTSIPSTLVGADGSTVNSSGKDTTDSSTITGKDRKEDEKKALQERIKSISEQIDQSFNKLSNNRPYWTTQTFVSSSKVPFQPLAFVQKQLSSIQLSQMDSLIASSVNPSKFLKSKNDFLDSYYSVEEDIETNETIRSTVTKGSTKTLPKDAVIVKSFSREPISRYTKDPKWQQYFVEGDKGNRIGYSYELFELPSFRFIQKELAPAPASGKKRTAKRPVIKQQSRPASPATLKSASGNRRTGTSGSKSRGLNSTQSFSKLRPSSEEEADIGWIEVKDTKTMGSLNFDESQASLRSIDSNSITTTSHGRRTPKINTRTKVKGKSKQIETVLKRAMALITDEPAEDKPESEKPTSKSKKSRAAPKRKAVSMEDFLGSKKAQMDELLKTEKEAKKMVRDSLMLTVEDVFLEEEKAWAATVFDRETTGTSMQLVWMRVLDVGPNKPDPDDFLPPKLSSSDIVQLKGAYMAAGIRRTMEEDEDDQSTKDGGNESRPETSGITQSPIEEDRVGLRQRAGTITSGTEVTTSIIDRSTYLEDIDRKDKILTSSDPDYVDNNLNDDKSFANTIEMFLGSNSKAAKLHRFLGLKAKLDIRKKKIEQDTKKVGKEMDDLNAEIKELKDLSPEERKKVREQQRKERKRVKKEKLKEKAIRIADGLDNIQDAADDLSSTDSDDTQESSTSGSSGIDSLSLSTEHNSNYSFLQDNTSRSTSRPVTATMSQQGQYIPNPSRMSAGRQSRQKKKEEVKRQRTDDDDSSDDFFDINSDSLLSEESLNWLLDESSEQENQEEMLERGFTSEEPLSAKLGVTKVEDDGDILSTMEPTQEQESSEDATKLDQTNQETSEEQNENKSENDAKESDPDAQKLQDNESTTPEDVVELYELDEQQDDDNTERSIAEQIETASQLLDETKKRIKSLYLPPDIANRASVIPPKGRGLGKGQGEIPVDVQRAMEWEYQVTPREEERRRKREVKLTEKEDEEAKMEWNKEKEATLKRKSQLAGVLNKLEQRKQSVSLQSSMKSTPLSPMRPIAMKSPILPSTLAPLNTNVLRSDVLRSPPTPKTPFSPIQSPMLTFKEKADLISEMIESGDGSILEQVKSGITTQDSVKHQINERVDPKLKKERKLRKQLEKLSSARSKESNSPDRTPSTSIPLPSSPLSSQAHGKRASLTVDVDSDGPSATQTPVSPMFPLTNAANTANQPPTPMRRMSSFAPTPPTMDRKVKFNVVDPDASTLGTPTYMARKKSLTITTNLFSPPSSRGATSPPKVPLTPTQFHSVLSPSKATSSFLKVQDVETRLESLKKEINNSRENPTEKLLKKTIITPLPDAFNVSVSFGLDSLIPDADRLVTEAQKQLDGEIEEESDLFEENPDDYMQLNPSISPNNYDMQLASERQGQSRSLPPRSETLSPPILSPAIPHLLSQSVKEQPIESTYRVSRHVRDKQYPSAIGLPNYARGTHSSVQTQAIALEKRRQQRKVQKSNEESVRERKVAKQLKPIETESVVIPSSPKIPSTSLLPNTPGSTSISATLPPSVPLKNSDPIIVPARAALGLSTKIANPKSHDIKAQIAAAKGGIHVPMERDTNKLSKSFDLGPLKLERFRDLPNLSNRGIDPRFDDPANLTRSFVLPSSGFGTGASSAQPSPAIFPPEPSQPSAVSQPHLSRPSSRSSLTSNLSFYTPAPLEQDSERDLRRTLTIPDFGTKVDEHLKPPSRGQTNREKRLTPRLDGTSRLPSTRNQSDESTIVQTLADKTQSTPLPKGLALIEMVNAPAYHLSDMAFIPTKATSTNQTTYAPAATRAVGRSGKTSLNPLNRSTSVEPSYRRMTSSAGGTMKDTTLGETLPSLNQTTARSNSSLSSFGATSAQMIERQANAIISSIRGTGISTRNLGGSAPRSSASSAESMSKPASSLTQVSALPPALYESRFAPTLSSIGYRALAQHKIPGSSVSVGKTNK
ncbi:hypothetical protein BLNAU_8376 [Blattamonas nauphoetae]|uniref:Uncharacterized protein n=1 Tax=Blattamonas nauphoetae TaxID=2049346 RepID=A0ABQ9XZ29_9EUKA|nr:hypothetical protein BLNAU_8376 [Blattamonas nauphoetae]